MLPLAATAIAPVTDPQAAREVRRTLDLLSVVVEEYREGVADGQIVIPIEYEEARGFLREAEDRFGRAVPGTTPPADFDFAALRAALERKADITEIERLSARLRDWIRSRTGVVEEVFPPAAPSMARGRTLFEENCVACHGTAADGRGPEASRLDPPPASFVDAAFMDRETPFAFFHVIGLGRGSSAMPAWAETLSLQERWDLVAYLWSVRHGETGLARGQGLYLEHCASCHGATGDGRGSSSQTLIKSPPDLSSPASLAQTSDAELFEKVTHGVPDSPMPASARTLTDDERRSIVAYLRQLSLGGIGTTAPPDPAAAARRLSGAVRMVANDYRRAGATTGDTARIAAAQGAILLEQARKRAGALLADLEKIDAAAAALLAAELAKFEEAVRTGQPADAVSAAAARFAAALEGRFAPTGAAPPPADGALKETHRLLEESLAAYKRDDPAAAYLVSDAYFAFEPLERKLALANPELVRAIEARFLELRGTVGRPDDVDAATSLVAALHRDLERAAATALEPRLDATVGVFIQSLLIILREGFEVVLLITALLAYVAKAGHPTMKRHILAGTAAGIGMSLTTALLFALLLRGTPGAAVEALEGITMLLASAVLFWVSYWLISRAEAERWQKFIQGKVKTALSRGNGLALAGTAFLAVYREGVETVLFYHALLGSSSANVPPVTAGIAAGSVLLAIVYVLFARLGMRIPIRPFFLVTSVFLYYLAITFAGRGVAELQEAGWAPTTPLNGWPRVDFFGIFPTVETTLAQGVLVLLLLYAVAVLWRRRTRAVEEKSAGLANSTGANVPTR